MGTCCCVFIPESYSLSIRSQVFLPNIRISASHYQTHPMCDFMLRKYQVFRIRTMFALIRRVFSENYKLLAILGLVDYKLTGISTD